MSDFDRLPPHSEDAEQAVLGCIFLNPQDCMAECVETLKPGPKVFYVLTNQMIYEKMLVLYDERSVIDVITVAEALKTAGSLDQIGGIPYLSGLADKTPSWHSLGAYLAIVADKFRLRRVIQVSTEAVCTAYEGAHEPQAVVDNFERQALAISGELAGEIDFSIKPSVQNAIQTIERLHSSGGAITGLATGLVDYDKMTSGMKPGEMIVIGGRPSSGKSSLAMNVADRVAIEQKAPVGVFSLEMSKDSLVFRMICCRARVNVRNISEGFLAEREFPKLSAAAGRVNRAPLYIDDSPSLSVSQMRARARRMVSLYGIKLFIVDFLQRLYSTNPRVRSRAEEIADISNGIKTLAKELNLPVVALSQLNRDVDKEKGRRPRLSDLKECLSVEDSFLFTTDGVQRNTSSRMNTYSLNSSNLLVSQESVNVPKRKSSVIRIRTRSGRELVCTRAHPILTDTGWVPASSLTADHAIAAVRRLEQPSGTIDIPEARWIGWMLGNGGMNGYSSPSFICSCPVLASHFVQATKDLFGVSPKDNPHYRCKVVQQFYITASTVRTPEGNPVTKWLKQHDLWGRTAPDKLIPEWFMQQANNRSIAELICGLIETDGSVYSSPKPTVSFGTTSKMLAQQFLWCCARLGLFPRLGKGITSEKATRPLYPILFSEGLEISRLKEQLRIIGRKGDALAKLTLSDHGSNHGDRLGAWVSRAIGKVAKDCGISWATLGYRDQDKRISQADLAKAHRNLCVIGVRPRWDKLLSKLGALVSDSIYWDRLYSIQDAGTALVFDRKVRGSHNFVCNGLIVHNSSAIEQDADTIGLLYRPEQSREDGGMDEDSVPVNLLIAKQRDGPTGEIPLLFLRGYTRFESAAKVSDDDVLDGRAGYGSPYPDQ